jgi:uncharacterized protein Usg
VGRHGWWVSLDLHVISATCSLFSRYVWNHFSAIPRIPNLEIFRNNISWSTKLNAFDKSWKIPILISFSSNDL